MIQEEKELLLKDLCARLPYNVFVNINGIKCILQPHDISDFIKCDIDIKPYLFPLSSMTEEQWIDLKEYSGFKYDGCLLDLVKYTDSVSTLEFWVEEIPSNMIIRVFDWLNKNHFDYRGLIQLGLSLDATGLNIY